MNELNNYAKFNLKSTGSGLTEANAKEFLKQLSDCFIANEKVKTCTTLTKLVTMRYKRKGNIREYIMDMSNLVTKLSNKVGIV